MIKVNSIAELKKLESDVLAELKKYIGSAVTNTACGECILENVTDIFSAEDKYNAFIVLKTNDGLKNFYYRESKAVISETFDNLLTELAATRKEYLERNAAILKAKYEAERIEREARQAEYEAQLAEKKKQAKINKQIAKYNGLRKSIRNVVINDNFYTMLGWLAKNTVSIEAAMPDYLEPAFIKDFGEDVKHRVVTGTTSGGYDMQFTFSFKMRVKKTENTPISIATKVNDKNLINDTEFVYMLCSEYGFKFGKEQDYETILANIPTVSQAEFNVGYNM